MRQFCATHGNINLPHQIKRVAIIENKAVTMISQGLPTSPDHFVGYSDRPVTRGRCR